MSMLFIESERLRIQPLTHQQLLLYRDNLPQLEQVLGLTTSSMQIEQPFLHEMEEALNNFCLPNTYAYPDLYPWYTNWIIISKQENTIIGGISFGGYPDDYGITTIGYMIDKQQWGQGYATEGLLAVTKWGFSFSVLKAIHADTTPDKPASQKVLAKAGFTQIHKQDGSLHYKLSKP